MKIERLTLSNFGLYGGEQTFDLSTDAKGGRNVVLIKGHNGSGKTTFLEAIRLVLYGRRALGSRVAQRDYEDYLLRKIYVFAIDRTASIELAFSRVEHGEVRLYNVRRSWAGRGSSVVETLDLVCDGGVIDELEREDFALYLQDLIPAGVSQLFFFDGEKIQQMADDTAGEELRDSIGALLGLDLVEQLGTDLALYVGRQQEYQHGVDLDELFRDQESVGNQVVEAEERRASLTSRRDQVVRQVERSERLFRDEGGRVARDRDQIKTMLDAAEVERKSLLAELRVAASDVLPFNLAPRLCAHLAEVAERMRAHHSTIAIREFIDSFESDRQKADGEGLRWSSEHFEMLRSALGPAPVVHTSPLNSDPDWILKRLATLHDGRSEAANELATRIDVNLSQRTELERQLQAFDAGLADEALQALKKAEYELGSVEALIQKADEEIANLRRQRDLTERLWRTACADLGRQAATTRSVDLAIRTRHALSEFAKELLNERISALKRHFIDCFNRLIRKSNLVKAVELEPHSFEVQLVGENDVIIPKVDLSAGERQIFAISMLWALGCTSGRQLPIVIDTPFSRLDHWHRTTILRDYVPSASEQVILLCTDTEMTDDLEKMLSQHVARTYEVAVPNGQQGTILTQAPSTLEEVA